MKFVSYRRKKSEDKYRTGLIVGNYVYDLKESYDRLNSHTKEKSYKSFPEDPHKFWALGFKGIKEADKIYQGLLDEGKNIKDLALTFDELVFGPPNPAPEKIICIGLNYRDHIEEMNSIEQDYPVLFSKFNNALIGPSDPIEKNPLTSKLDYEVELVAVIGKKAKNVQRENAYDYISGYTIGNDISARDLQKRTPQWLQGKSLDRSTPIGPWIVTYDEIDDPENLGIRSYVNGELRQNSNTKNFIFDLPYLIEFISHLMTLKPGDLIFTGTPMGVAMGMENPKFLNEGDVVRLEIDKIGVLENKVVRGK